MVAAASCFAVAAPRPPATAATPPARRHFSTAHECGQQQRQQRQPAVERERKWPAPRHAARPSSGKRWLLLAVCTQAAHHARRFRNSQFAIRLSLFHF